MFEGNKIVDQITAEIQIETILYLFNVLCYTFLQIYTSHFPKENSLFSLYDKENIYAGKMVNFIQKLQLKFIFT